MTSSPTPITERDPRGAASMGLRRPGLRRRGSMYVLVLMTASIVTVIGSTAIMVTRIQGRSSQTTDDLGDAQICARAAVEFGRSYISRYPNWRTDRPHGRWVTDQPLGKGTFSLDVTDPDDGSLSDDPGDFVVLAGTGVRGQTRWRTQVTLSAKAKPKSSLEVAVAAGQNIVLTGATLTTDQTISANNTVSSFSSTVTGTVQALNGILNLLGGTQTPVTTARVMPGNDVFDHYIANGTAIPMSSLPLANGTRVLENVLLSPAVNPYGAENASGIYVIDTLGQALLIHRARVVGTLVLLNSTTATVIDGAVNMEPAVANYPAMLVRGSVTVRPGLVDLQESTAPAVNLNPVDTPFNGSGNAVATDSFESLIKGIVYASDELHATDAAFKGIVVTGTNFRGGGILKAYYADPSYITPPPGFISGYDMKLSTGTWKRPTN